MRIFNLQLLMSLCIHYIDYSIILFDEKKYILEISCKNTDTREKRRDRLI